MMNIGFDLDGVLYPWHEVCYDYCLEEGLTKLDYDTFWTKYVFENYTFSYNLMRIPFLYSRRLPDKSVMEMLYDISKDHELFYITSRPSEAHYSTEKYIQSHDFPCKYNLIFSEEKDEIAAIYDIKIFVEDNLSNARKLKSVCYPVIIDKPWNVSDNQDIMRLNHILEFKTFLEDYEKH